MLHKYSLWRTLRITAWVARFVRNTRSPTLQRKRGLLTTEELNVQRRFWEKRAQQEGLQSEQFEKDRLQLNLQQSDQQLLECRGRIQGVYPLYLPDTAVYTKKFVQEAHEATLHGGLGLTMAKVREKHWVPRLRRLAKRIIKSCPGCPRPQLLPFHPPDYCHETEPKDHVPFKLWACIMPGRSGSKPQTNEKGKCTLSYTLAVYQEPYTLTWPGAWEQANSY